MSSAHKGDSSDGPGLKEGLEAQIGRLNLALVGVFDSISSNRLTGETGETESFTSTKRSLPSPDEFSVSSEGQELLLQSPFFLESRLEEALLENEQQRMLIEDFRAQELRTASARGGASFVEKTLLCGALMCTAGTGHREEELLACVEALNCQVAQLKSENKLAGRFLKVAEDMTRGYAEHSNIDEWDYNCTFGYSNEEIVKKEVDVQVRAETVKKDEARARELCENYQWQIKECELTRENVNKQLQETIEIKVALKHRESALLSKELSLQRATEQLEGEKTTIEVLKKLQSSEIGHLRTQLESILQEEKPALNLFIPTRSTDLLVAPRDTGTSDSSGLQQRLQQLESQAPNKKLALKIDRVKNQLSTIRGEKAIYDSIKTATALQSKLSQCKALSSKTHCDFPAKPTTKQQLARSSTGYEEQYVNLYEIKAQANLLQKQQAATRKLLDAKRKVLEDKEAYLSRRTEGLLSKWMREPNARDLIANLQFAIAELTSERTALDRQKDIFLQEKFELDNKKNQFAVKLRKISEETKREQVKVSAEKSAIENVKSHLKKLLPNLNMNNTL